MSLFFITGIAGAGKSTVLSELKRRGYEVHDADENLSSWEHKVTRERVSASDHKLSTDPTFFEEHDWYIDKAGVEKLANEAADKTVFLGGSVANEDEVWECFNEVFCLFVGDETLELRIKNRIDKDFGKSDHELAHLLKLNQQVKDKYSSLGAIMINATKPVGDIADEVVRIAEAVKSN